MSGNLSICSISPEIREQLKKFKRNRSMEMNTLILKIDRTTHELGVEEELLDTSVDELTQALPAQQPRFLVVNYPMVADDGRAIFPICFVYFSPVGCNPEVQMLYAGSKNMIVNECQLPKNFELRDLDDLSHDYFKTRLQ
uniref:ADF-H domain-containing protein n=1 Tax=Rhabditophanes sp. KR3021 TaxID=114890 RepID=A0AC35TGL5_9BILA